MNTTTDPTEMYDTPESCPECGAGDAEYGTHHYGCPSGYAAEDAPCDECRTSPEANALHEAAREYEDEIGYGAVLA